MARPSRLPVLLLILSAMLFRGLIPAGFMPATARAARHGALLVACPHGAMAMPMPMAGAPGGEHGGAPDGHGKHLAHAGVEQCPFGAAVGLALPATLPVLALPVALGHLSQVRAAIASRGPPPYLQPPARGPPDLS